MRNNSKYDTDFDKIGIFWNCNVFSLWRNQHEKLSISLISFKGEANFITARVNLKLIISKNEWNLNRCIFYAVEY